MKILIYGSKGWIGSMVAQYLKDKDIEFVEGKSRLDNVVDVENEILSIDPTNVICLVGRTHGFIDKSEYKTIDYLEQPGKLYENIRDNLFSQMALAKLCYDENIHATIINTGCIFTYDQDHPEGDIKTPFYESDEANFFDSSYSIVKGFTDKIMKLYPKTVCNCRIRMPISSQPNTRNFITKIINYEKICSVPNSMTVLDDLIPVMIELCKKRWTGTINLTNPGIISHNEILEMYKGIVDPEFTWKNFTYEEQMKILAAGRSNNYLCTDLLESKFVVPNIKYSVRMVLLKYKKNMENDVCDKN